MKKLEISKPEKGDCWIEISCCIALAKAKEPLMQWHESRSKIVEEGLQATRPIHDEQI